MAAEKEIYSVKVDHYNLERIAEGLAVALEGFPQQVIGGRKIKQIDPDSIIILECSPSERENIMSSSNVNLKDDDKSHVSPFLLEAIIKNIIINTLSAKAIDRSFRIFERSIFEVIDISAPSMLEKTIDITKDIMKNSKYSEKIYTEYRDNKNHFLLEDSYVESSKRGISPLFKEVNQDLAVIKGKMNKIDDGIEKINKNASSESIKTSNMDRNINKIMKKLGIEPN